MALFYDSLFIQENEQIEIVMIRYPKLGMVLVACIYVLWVVAYTFFDYQGEKQQLYASIDKQLVTAATLTPILLPENLHHQAMVKADLSDEAHSRNELTLSQFTDSNDVIYIYTLIMRDNKVLFTSSSATKEERETGEGLTKFWDHYDDVAPQVYDIFKTKEKRFLEYSDQWGSFRSVYIPHYSIDTSFYLTVADISIDHIQTILIQQLYQSLLTALLFLLCGYPLYLVSTKGIKRIAHDLEQKVALQTEALVQSDERFSYAMTAAHQGWFDLNLKTGEIKVSDEYVRILGYEPKEFKTDLETWQQNIHPDDLEGASVMMKQTLQTGGPDEHEYRRKSKSGNWLWLHSVGKVVEWDNDNKPTRVVGLHADVTERKQTEHVLRMLAESGAEGTETILQLIVKQLARSQNTLYAFIGSLSQTNKHHIETLAVWGGNDYAENFTYSLENTPCENVTSSRDVCFYPNHLQSLFPKDHLLVEMGAVSYIGVPLISSQGEVIGLIALLDDKPLDERPYTRELLNSLAVRAVIEIERIEANRQLELAARVFSGSHDGIIVTDVDGTIIDINPAFTRITAYEREDVLGRKPNILSSGKHDKDFYDDMWQSLKNAGFWIGEVWNRKKNGELYAERLEIASLKDNEDSTTHYLGMFSDITESKEHQHKLELMAHYDVLTQLPNRTLFNDRFMQAIAHTKRENSLLAVCFLDLDNFKPVNDNHGHKMGDQLLVEVAKRIASVLREEDTVSRQGGDEFALLLSDIGSVNECETLLTRLHKHLAEPYFLDDNEINIGASSGVTLYPVDNSDIDTLIRHADQAMYRAKLAGKNQYYLFDIEDDALVTQKQQKLDEISRGLDNGEFSLYYQPKVDMNTGNVFGAEALIRWHHPEKGLIPPLDFLPFIEGLSLEVKLGEWVINQGLKQLNAWKQKGIEIEISVNISSYHLQDSDFFSYLIESLALFPDIDSAKFQLEILESSALGNVEKIGHIIRQCRDLLGVKIALDDFGTGYSSLTHLRSLAANTIKIDQSFVRDMLDDPNDYAIIDGVIGLADTFDREVIAEGVETTEHGLMLLMMGCNQAQGYGISRPMPASEFIGWLNSYKPNQQWTSLNNEDLSIVDIQRKLFILVTNKWKHAFEKNILADPGELGEWPIMRKTKCSCGTWIKRAGQAFDFEPQWLIALEQAHDELHQTADDLFSHYQEGDVFLAREELSRLNQCFDKLMTILQTGP